MEPRRRFSVIDIRSFAHVCGLSHAMETNLLALSCCCTALPHAFAPPRVIPEKKMSHATAGLALEAEAGSHGLPREEGPLFSYFYQIENGKRTNLGFPKPHFCEILWRNFGWPPPEHSCSPALYEPTLGGWLLKGSPRFGKYESQHARPASALYAGCASCAAVA